MSMKDLAFQLYLYNIHLLHEVLEDKFKNVKVYWI